MFWGLYASKIRDFYCSNTPFYGLLSTVNLSEQTFAIVNTPCGPDWIAVVHKSLQISEMWKPLYILDNRHEITQTKMVCKQYLTTCVRQILIYTYVSHKIGDDYNEWTLPLLILDSLLFAFFTRVHFV